MSDQVDRYEQILARRRTSRSYLLQNSGLPGPRANIELARAFAKTASQKVIEEYAAISAEEAPANTPGEFLAFCGTLGLGRLATEGKKRALTKLRNAASDERWRTREAVAMALQTIGENDMESLLGIAREWSHGNFFEKRAAAAGICEPALLQDSDHAEAVFKILKTVTGGIENAGKSDRGTEGFKALRKGLAYCWSVAVAAYPGEGKPTFVKWLEAKDQDIRWIVQENLKKNRLLKMDADWVKSIKEKSRETE